MPLPHKQANVSINTVKTDNKRRNGDDKTYTRTRDIKHTQSDITSGGNTTINAGKSVELQSANLNTNGNLSVTAKQDILMSAVKDVAEEESKTHSSNSGLFSSSESSTHAYDLAETAKGTTINAKNITLNAGVGTILQNADLTADTVESESQYFVMDTLKTKNKSTYLSKNSDSMLGGISGSSTEKLRCKTNH